MYNGETLYLEEGDVITIKVNKKETATPSTQQPNAPVTEEPKDKGKLLYKFGLISDLHFNVEDKHNSEYMADLINALQFFRSEGVEFIDCAGDLCEYNEEDFERFRDVYNAHAFAPTGGQLRLFNALGNHDYLMMYSQWSDIKRILPCFTNFTGEDMWQQYGYTDKKQYLQFFEYDGKWNEQYVGDRTVKSKLSYWFEAHGDIHVILSIDYGDAQGEVWDEQARGFRLLDHNDNYVQQMKDYVADTNYIIENGSFDYQFYHPNALIWLRDILENNRDRRVFVVMHHPLPHKAGDGDGIYSRLRIWPYTDSKAVRQKFYSGSNTLCGLTFWYVDKLTNEYPNAVFISGHTHRQWNDGISICRNDYVVRKPKGNEVTPLVDDINALVGTEYDYRLYTREHQPYCGDSCVTIGLPSLSKPVDNCGRALYGASEGAVMEVYENATILRCIEFKNEKDTTYENKEILKATL